jgi:hypothetical protein
MEVKLTKEIAKELMKIKGETRGFNIKHDGDYILKEKGEEGLKKLEEELEKLGYSIKYRELKDMDFYPAGLRAASLLAIKKVFGFDDQKIREICGFHPKTSLVIKLFMKHFYSVEGVLKAVPKIWRKYWTVGEADTSDFNEKEKYAVVKIERFDLHPIFCRCLEGYFETLGKMVVKSEKVSCQETKCTFEGQKFHEFLIKWE